MALEVSGAPDGSVAHMNQPRRRVYLDGGSFDGTTALALPPPATLTVPVLEKDESVWLETYVHVAGLTKSTREDGPLPVMRFHHREAEK